MGYTHYWTNQQFSSDEIDEVLKLASAVIDATDIPVGDGMGEGEPEIDRAGICLNGADDNDCEPFHVDFTSDRMDFCKTANRPYDTVVVAILMAIKQVVPSFDWSSDGEVEDHAAGKALLDVAKKKINMTRPRSGNDMKLKANFLAMDWDSEHSGELAELCAESIFGDLPGSMQQQLLSGVLLWRSNPEAYNFDPAELVFMDYICDYAVRTATRDYKDQPTSGHIVELEIIA